jgi:hypothetical protein
MGWILLVAGLVMNATGVAMGSSRDLSRLCRAAGDRIAKRTHAIVSRTRALWARIRRREVATQVLSVEGAGHTVFGGSATVFAWDAVPDGLEPAQAIARLRSRTDNLHQMIAFESTRRREDVDRLSQEVSSLGVSTESRLTALDSRIDDLDVKPARQRAMGAILVICGSILMFAGAVING